MFDKKRKADRECLLDGCMKYEMYSKQADYRYKKNGVWRP